MADFGLAAVCTSELQGKVGTLHYMAPQVQLVNLGKIALLKGTYVCWCRPEVKQMIKVE